MLILTSRVVGVESVARVKIFYPLPPLLDWALQRAGPWVGTQAVEW